jgi:phosphoserine phosphatase
MDAAPVVVSDLDGTLTMAETWRGVLAWVRAHHPSPAARRFVAIRLPLVVRAKLGLYDKEAFRARWLEEEARLLRGLTSRRLDEMAEWVVEHDLWPARRQAGVDAVLAATRSGGERPATLILATAGYQPVADAFARRLGAATAVGTPLAMISGIATGGLAAPVRSGDRKAAEVLERSAGAAIRAAFGDSAADIPLLALAARPVAIAPDGALRRAAVERGWEILEDA